jgi:hypothetical protein
VQYHVRCVGIVHLQGRAHISNLISPPAVDLPRLLFKIIYSPGNFKNDFSIILTHMHMSCNFSSVASVNVLYYEFFTSPMHPTCSIFSHSP